MRLFHGILPFVVGCHAASALVFEPIHTPAEISALTETVYAGATAGAASLDAFEIVANRDGALAVMDPLTTAPQTLRRMGPAVVSATRTQDGAMLIASDAGLLLYDGFLQTSAIDALLDSPAVQVQRGGSALWIRTGGGVYLWRQQILSAITWKQEPLTIQLGLGASERGVDLVWSGNKHGLVAVAETDKGWVPVVTLEDVSPTGLTVDARGVLIAAADEGIVVRKDEAWTAWTMPFDVVAVLGNSASDGAWIVGSADLFWTDGEHFERLTALPEDVTLDTGAASVDAAGRLLLVGDENLYRVAHTPTVALLGLRNGAPIDGETTVIAQTTPVEGVTSVKMAVDDLALTVTDDRATLDPFLFLDGKMHRVQATVTWDDARVAVGGADFTVGSVGTATWDANVSPLFMSRCANCHSGSTQTQLDGREIWEERVDDILTEVTSKRMPLGGPPMTGAEISIIRAWKEGGFQ